MARKLKLMEAPFDHMIAALIRDGWDKEQASGLTRAQAVTAVKSLGYQDTPPTASQKQDHPGTWHIWNPGHEGNIGTKAFSVEKVMIPGGICRPYQATVRKADLPEFAGALAKHIFREISELDQFEGLVRLKDVAEVLVKYLPKSEGE